MTAPVEVVAGVFLDGTRVLACRRAPHTTAAGKWEFPGGKVEPGESSQDALARELHEELGVAVAVGRLIVRETTGTIDLAVYEVEPVDGFPTRSTDHDELLWIGLAVIGSLDWADPDRPAVRGHRMVLKAGQPLSDPHQPSAQPRSALSDTCRHEPHPPSLLLQDTVSVAHGIMAFGIRR
ncbi:(deoxy)nucleoside triphosphate pyrophosphohydrolase [Gryllotalpicola sp.]|uniref:(deoxy)nucleoside triphosphate pyrophosphohydrolase n=1 Tax=Gryllotalpicola sp. TaxID=1932787 RepID=UPI002618CD87|nr:(deoxy)nucleoside triphosphate pyrophosphohydrolase [Gryllotalpicola sp.]